MPTSRNKLIKNISVIENRLNSQAAYVVSHKNYFSDLVSDNRSLLVLVFIPVFLWGWGLGGRERTRLMVSKLLNISLMAVIKMAGKSLLKAH